MSDSTLILLTSEQRVVIANKVKAARIAVTSDHDLQMMLYEWAMWLENVDTLKSDTLQEALISAIAVGFAEGLAYKAKKDACKHGINNSKHDPKNYN